MPYPFVSYSDEEFRRAIQEYEGSGLEDALIKALQLPVEERKAFIEGLSLPYDEMRTDLRSEIERNYNTMMGPSPEGRIGSNNPFGYYVAANPLEHLASGINKYQAAKDLKSQRQELKDLAKRQADTTAFQKMAQAEALRNAVGQTMTPEELEEERLRRLRGRSGYGGGSFGAIGGW